MKSLAQQKAIPLFLPAEYPDYSSKDYWQTRYTQELGISAHTTEWYLTYAQLEPILQPRLYEDKETEVMVVGCGNSDLGAHLY